MVCPISENTVELEKVQNRAPKMIKVMELFSHRKQLKLKLFSIGGGDYKI